MVWSHRRLFLALRREGTNGAASRCDHGQPQLLCPRVWSISPHPSVFCHPDGAVAAVLARSCHLPAFCGAWWVWVGAILPVLESVGSSSFQLSG